MNGKPNGVGVKLLTIGPQPVTGGGVPGGIDFVQDPEIAPLRAQLGTVRQALSALQSGIVADSSAPTYDTDWTGNLAGGPNVAFQLFDAIDQKLDQLSTKPAELTACRAQLAACQTQLAAAQSAPPVAKSTQPTGVFVSAPATVGIAAGSGLLGFVAGWWAKGRR